MKRFSAMILAVLAVAQASAAGTFWIGADISGATQMEDRGELLYDADGKPRECTELMKELGFNAVRLRVWVNPKDGYSSKEDVLKKALRAKKLGMPVMIDFHYSDTWADPAKQTIPEAWKDHDYITLRKDVARHTMETLQLLKKNGIKPQWVQIGNETRNGMLWPIGHATTNPKQYAGLFKAGYAASKKVFPNAAVIVHLDNGFDNAMFNWNLDILKENGARWDIIGLSVYPYWAKRNRNLPHDQTLEKTAENMKALVKKYHTDVMVVETGFEVDEGNPEKIAEGRREFAQLIRICKTIPRCRGIFYWAPECRPAHYRLGAFGSDGRPTKILSAIKD